MISCGEISQSAKDALEALDRHNSEYGSIEAQNDLLRAVKVALESVSHLSDKLGQITDAFGKPIFDDGTA